MSERKVYNNSLFLKRSTHDSSLRYRSNTNMIVIYISGFDKEVVISDVQLNSLSGLMDGSQMTKG